MPLTKRRRIDTPGSSARAGDEDSDAELKAALAASLAAVEERVACPLCSRTYPLDAIQRHASVCEGGDTELGAVKHEDGSGTDQGAASRSDHATLHDEQAMAPPHEAVPSPRGSPTTSTAPPLPAERKAALDAPHGTHTGKPTRPPNDTQRRGRRAKTAPFYKRLEGMPIAVDAFQYGAIPACTAYVLTHFHSDHYGGLSKRWDHGPIYCSASTARLVRRRLGVADAWLRPLPMNTRTSIPDTDGVEVTLIDANHCPGACLFLFEGPSTSVHGRAARYLHCGDFRACPAQVRHPALAQTVDAVYLDTTYLHPRHCFPAQPQVVEACAELVTMLARGKATQARQTTLPWATPNQSMLAQWLGHTKPAPSTSSSDLLVLVGTYSIGKENLVLALARALHTRIYCVDVRKMETWSELHDPELDALLTTDPLQARVHVTNLFALTPQFLRRWSDTLRAKGMRISHTLAFKPTGWSFRKKEPSVPASAPMDALAAAFLPGAFGVRDLEPTKESTTGAQVYHVPYSEHSSFYELMAFMTALPHRATIPTVNVGNERNRIAMKGWTDAWVRLSSRPTPIVPRSDLYW